MTKELTFKEFFEKNNNRSKHWHDGKPPWTVSDWATAMAGEAGEVCNAVKKLRRIQDNLPNNSDSPDRTIDTHADAVQHIAEEIADTITYLGLLADHLDIDIPRALIEKFNKVSERNGFPHTFEEMDYLEEPSTIGSY